MMAKINIINQLKNYINQFILIHCILILTHCVLKLGFGAFTSYSDL